MTQTPNQTSVLYRRLLRYIFPYKHYFFISVVGFALFACMEALLVRTVELFLNALEGKPTAWVSHFPSEITESILFVPLAIIALSTLRGVGSYLGSFYMSKVGLNVVNTLRQQVFAHLIYLPQEFFDKQNSGEVISLIVYNIEQVTGSVTNAIKILFRDGFSVLGFLAVMLFLNWKLTLIFFAIAPILAGLVYIAGRYFRKVSRKIQIAIGKITHITNESVQGIRLVKSYRGEDYEVNRFEQAIKENLTYGTKFERVNAVQTPIMHIVIAAALALIFLLVLLFWPSGDAAGAIAFVTTAGIIAKPFRQLSSINSMIQKGMAAAETIFATLDLKPEEDTGTKHLTNVRGEIIFSKVNFGYNPEQAALKQFDLHIKPGETIALVGQSGSGKSTIANLLLRLYNVNSGDITIDGISIKDIQLSSLRKHIALVNQQTILFNDTIAANITYGDHRQNILKEDIEKAAERAYASQFIQYIEGGIDADVGEDGSKLSGGQRQRIAIARALFKNAPILILDEATSALDNESEKQIQNALETLKKGRTTIIIAHRLSTIESADKIVVLDQGELVEVGDHATLIAKNGYYANLHKTQLSPSDTADSHAV